MQHPHEIHYKESKRILWYIRGIVQFGIHYNTWETPLLVCFRYFDWHDDPNDWNSTIGYVFILILGPVTEACKK